MPKAENVTKCSQPSKIQLIATEQQPVLGILTGFYMTAVLNIITWNKAYCLFPRETLHQRKTYMLKHVDNYFVRLIRKYSDRGFQCEETMSEENYSAASGLQESRRIGDKHTMILDLPTDGLLPEKALPDHVLENSVFVMAPRRGLEHDSLSNYVITANSFQHLGLDHPVTYGADRGRWMEYLAVHLHDRAHANIICMKPDQRPIWWKGYKTRTHGQDHYEFYRNNGAWIFADFEKPHGWRNYDDQVAMWYEDWLAEVSEEDKKLITVPEVDSWLDVA